MNAVDWEHGDHDLVFRANAREDVFAWAGAAATADEVATGALAILGRLWCPARAEVEVGALTGEDGSEVLTCQIEGDPDPVTVAGEVGAVVRRAVSAHPGWGLLMIGPALEGWARLALPPGVEAPAAWSLVSDDGVTEYEHEWRHGPREAGRRTVWLRLRAPAASSDVEVQRVAAGRLVAKLRLGAVFFTPGLELRAPDTEVRGAPVVAWQEANAAMLAGVLADFEAAGWRAQH